MIVLDANILLYAYNSATSLHAKARAWIEETFSSSEPVGIPWQTVTAFLRITTNSKFPGQRFNVNEAVEIMEAWLGQPNIQLLAPSDTHWQHFRCMLLDGQASGQLVSDAHLAALALEYGGVLYTTDRDFARFPGLRWKNPLF